MYGVLCEDTTKTLDDRMMAGLLLERTPAEAAELLDEFDANRDGQFDQEEIKSMMAKVNSGTIDRLGGFEEKAEKKLQALREKHEKAKAKHAKAVGDEDVPIRRGDLESALAIE